MLLLGTLTLGLAACDPAPPPEPVNDTTTRSAFPQDSTTGPELTEGLDEENLPPCDHAPGAWNITVADTVVERCQHVGIIRVQAPGVIIRDARISAPSGTAVPVVTNQFSSHLLIERSIIHNADPDPENAPTEPCAAAVGFGNYTLSQSEVYGCSDGLKLSGTVNVDRSFIHDMTRWCEPGQVPSPTTCTHNDGLQANNPNQVVHLTLTGSAVYMNSCISNRIIQTGPQVSSSYDLSRNFLYGSHGIANIGLAAGGAVTGTFTENLIAGTPTAGPFSADANGTAPGLYTGDGMAAISRAGNFFEDGSPVPENGQMSPYSCAPTVPTTTTTTAPTTTTTTVPETTTTTAPTTTTTEATTTTTVP